MKIDIRSKLKNHEKPTMVIAEGVEVTVNNDAIAILEVMEIINGTDDKSISSTDILLTLRKLFNTTDFEKIKKLGLDFNALITLIMEAVETVQGVNDEKN